MQPISKITSGAAQSSVSIADVDDSQKVQRPEKDLQKRHPKTVMDEYVPGEKPEPSGRYRPVQDEDGTPKIYFDNPEHAEPLPKEQGNVPGQDKGAESAKKSESEKNGKICTCNTDKVDREIENLKKQKQELEQQINRETDITKAKDLKVKLAHVEKELGQKDNDTYRRQHAVYTFS